MQRMKLFSSAACADDLAMLERIINEWIDGSGVRIMQMTQSQFGTHLVICLIYMYGGEDTARHAEASVAVPEVFGRTMEGAELDPDDADRPLPQAELPY